MTIERSFSEPFSELRACASLPAVSSTTAWTEFETKA